MRRMDVFCPSQASTAICMSIMDQPSSSSATIQLGGRAIDRHNPMIRDQKRIPRTLPIPPCTSQSPPINPKPYHLLHKSRTKKGSNDHQIRKSSKMPSDTQKIKNNSSKPNSSDNAKKNIMSVAKDIARKSWAKPGDCVTPPGSSRYLLSDAPFVDGLSDFDPVFELVPTQSNKTTQALSNQDESTSKPPPSSTSERPTNQVVVLRVSLHCRGCEGKVRKHLSRMEGVTSYSIDFAAKKVTIVGDVTPLGVLASVSKVKNAQFWTSTTPAPGPNNTEIKMAN